MCLVLSVLYTNSLYQAACYTYADVRACCIFLFLMGVTITVACQVLRDGGGPAGAPLPHAHPRTSSSVNPHSLRLPSNLDEPSAMLAPDGTLADHT